MQNANAAQRRKAEHGEDDDANGLHNRVVARSDSGTAFYLFNHQAGGHKPFLRSARGEVCKPVIPLELHFYQALDSQFPQLKDFVPPFVGVVTVDLRSLAPPAKLKSDDSDTSSSDPVEDAQRPPIDDASAGEAAAVSSGQLMRALQVHSPNETATAAASAPLTSSTQTKKCRLEDKHYIDTSSSGPTRSFLATTSYSAKLWTQERARADSSPSSAAAQQAPFSASVSSITRDYLVLGDLTKRYSRPCVLDIKMGTRQHGEDAPPAKIKSHSAKCAATTSLALGLRLCGMQIYDAVEQRYILRDKQWGRQLGVEDIQPALITYLSNGSGLENELLVALRDKLQSLQCVVARTTGVRFWGASLLLIYEGDLRQTVPRQDVHLIDFAHSQMCATLDSPDEGLLLGLGNMISFLSNILALRKSCESIADMS